MLTRSHCRRLLHLWILSCVIGSVNLLPSRAYAQTPGCLTTNKPLHQSGLTYSFASELSSKSNIVDQAVGGWAGALSGSNVQFSGNSGLSTGGSSNIYIVIGDTNGSNAVASTECTSTYCSGGTITLNQDTISQWSDRYLRYILMHEIGHILGFSDKTGDARDYVMSEYSSYQDNNSNATSMLATCEYQTGNYTYNPPNCGTECSPLIVDIDGDGLEMTAAEVSFDLTGDGTRRVFGWTAGGSRDAFVFLDRNGNHIVDDGRELFGNVTPISLTFDGPRSWNGFEALRALDFIVNGGNNDGVVDERDEAFERLALWTDRNHDGLCQASETTPLAVKLKSIGLEYRYSSEVDAFGNQFRYFGFAVTRSGRSRIVVDVYLVVQ